MALKLEIETTKKRLEVQERILQLRKDQDAHLRDSIFQATREVRFWFSAPLPLKFIIYLFQRPSARWGRRWWEANVLEEWTLAV